MHTNLFEEPFPVGGGTPAVLNQCVLLTFRRASFAAQRARNLLKDVLSWGPCLFTNLVYAALFSLLLNFFSCLYNAAYCLFVCDIFVPVFVWFFSPLIFYFFWESSASTCIQVKAQIRETKSSSPHPTHIPCNRTPMVALFVFSYFNQPRTLQKHHTNNGKGKRWKKQMPKINKFFCKTSMKRVCITYM